jgi:hypothetical protein
MAADFLKIKNIPGDLNWEISPFLAVGPLGGCRPFPEPLKLLPNLSLYCNYLRRLFFRAAAGHYSAFS